MHEFIFNGAQSNLAPSLPPSCDRAIKLSAVRERGRERGKEPRWRVCLRRRSSVSPSLSLPHSSVLLPLPGITVGRELPHSLQLKRNQPTTNKPTTNVVFPFTRNKYYTRRSTARTLISNHTTLYFRLSPQTPHTIRSRAESRTVAFYFSRRRFLLAFTSFATPSLPWLGKRLKNLITWTDP